MRTPVRFGCAVTLITALALFYPGSDRSSALAQTFTVTTTADSGAGSLRQAIANVDSDFSNAADVITFQIPGTGAVQQIVLQSQLPSVTHPVLIDGYTEAGAQPNTLSNGINASLKIQLLPLVGAGAIADGLQVASTNCIVRGLVIGGFGTGIAISQGGNVIEGNFIGTGPTGTTIAGNTFNAISVASTGNTIGGTTPASRNLISGNSEDGIDISGTNNIVEGNFIGTDSTGTNALANETFGVDVLASGVSNTIGGTVAGAGNVISANGDNGIEIDGNNNVVLGNLIGTDITGAKPFGNANAGVFVLGNTNTIGGTVSGSGNVISGNGEGIGIQANNTTVLGNLIGTDITGTNAVGNETGVVVNGSSNAVGGTVTGAGNVISGNASGGGVVIAAGNDNTLQGNLIGTDITGARPLGNTSGVLVQGDTNTIGGTVAGARNVISGNQDDGIDMIGTIHTVQGNFIGTDITGTNALPNGFQGIDVEVSGSSNTIGGTVSGAGNIISANGQDGILIEGNNNTALGNFIGTDVTGTKVLSNGTGVVVSGASNNTIGGISPGAGNVISGNQFNGVDIDGNNNIVEGNFIGTDIAGTHALGNGDVGVSITVSSNTIGGAVAGARNVISGNFADGIDISANDNIVRGNFIGMDFTGANALPNGNNGVVMNEAVGNTIGGTNATDGNVVSGNSGDGIAIVDDDVDFPTEFNVVQGNLIGTDVTGANIVSNGASGILISDSFSGGIGVAAANTVGGLQPGAGNLIAGNGSNGVTIVGTNAVDNAIFGNSIFSNAVLGIDLGADGVTSNHAFLVFPSGPNNFQNFPVLTSAVCSNGGVLVQGTITNSGSATTAHLEFFANIACDPSGFGQGQVFLGSTNVVTDTNGGAFFAITFTTNLIGDFITATASDSSSNTSEFSSCIQVSVGPIITECATSMVVAADANCEAIVPDFTSEVQASDNCAPSNSLIFTQSPTNGTIAFVGTNVVTITVADEASNTTSCTADFIVVATNTGPLIITQCATSLVASAGEGCQAAVPDFTAQVQATDGCAPTGSLIKTQSPQAGTLVGGGARPVSIPVTITVANQTTNTTCIASFVVVNTPVITQCATSLVASADSNCQATLPDFTAQVLAIDYCLPGNLVITQSPVSGSSASLGTNAVTITVEDQASNTASCVANFIVVDTTPPVITACAPSITFPAGPGCQTNVPDFTAQVQATDNCSPNNLIITQSPTNGSIAFLGTNTVTITVADPAGNSTNCTTTFIVANIAPPNIACNSNITVTVGSSNTSAVVTFPTPTATENCSVTTTVTCVPPSGSVFPVGTTPVICTATDAVGNTASCTFDVTVLSPQQVIVDIEPGMCPNVLNTNDSVIQVAIVGTESLDVTTINALTVTLNGALADPTNSVIEDVSSPFVFTHGCPKKKKDGVLDLVVEFNVDQLIAKLGPIKNGEVKVLTVNGFFLDGNTFEGQDKIKISTKKCKLPKGLQNPF